MRLLVTGDGQQSGKTTVAKIFAKKCKVPYASSSEAILDYGFQLDANERIVKAIELGIAKEKTPEAVRPELIEAGNFLRSEGICPSMIKFNEGYQIVDGARTYDEVEYSRQHTIKGTFYHIHVVKGMKCNDNTEATKLHDCADYVIINDKDIVTLVNRCVEVYDEIK